MVWTATVLPPLLAAPEFGDIRYRCPFLCLLDHECSRATHVHRRFAAGAHLDDWHHE